MALRLLVAHTAAERDAARAVEARVFLQAFGNTADVMAEEYGPYDDRSRFVTVIDDADGSALGAVRLILPAGSGPVKTLADVAREPWQLPEAEIVQAAGLTGSTVWDVASLAVDPRFRRGAAGAEVTLALCHGLYQYSRACGVDGWVTVLDDRVLRLLRAMAIPWTTMAGAESRYYLGSPASTPCVCRIETIAGSIRSRRPDLVAALLEGAFRSIGSDPADLLPGRGACQPIVGERSEPYRPVSRRDTSGWRPPTHRRPEVVGAADPTR